MINSPVLDSLCSLNIDAKYVFIYLNIIINLLMKINKQLFTCEVQGKMLSSVKLELL